MKEENLNCVQNSQRDERKKPETIQDTPVECSKDSKARGEEQPIVE